MLLAAHIVCLSPGAAAAAEQLANNGELQQQQQGCPPWLQQYEALHAATRGQAHAKYLVFSIDGEGGGLGDRMRGDCHSITASPVPRRVQ